MTVLAFDRSRSRRREPPPREPASRSNEAPRLRLSPAKGPRPAAEQRLLALDPEAQSYTDHPFTDFASLLQPRDVLVVNDAATLPASLHVRDRSVEFRLLAWHADETFTAVALGPGDHRVATEERPKAPAFTPGARVAFRSLTAEIVHADADEPRLVRLRFEQRGAAFLRGLYASALPVQYAYAPKPFELWDIQNTYSARPWAFELPSAGRPITFEILGALRRRGVDVRSLTHAAGLSSTGSAALDRRLPLPERSDIPEVTVRAIARARAAGGRVIAAGTSVVRALESRFAEHGSLRAGTGVATLVLSPSFRPQVVDGLLTGLHQRGTSHFALLGAFAPEPLLNDAIEHAAQHGYLEHEFGDSMLILAGERGNAA
jgi:S-adenosylmethionine:tRNA ribosyltransferase-isomerase